MSRSRMKSWCVVMITKGSRTLHCSALYSLKFRPEGIFSCKPSGLMHVAHDPSGHISTPLKIKPRKPLSNQREPFLLTVKYREKFMLAEVLNSLRTGCTGRSAGGYTDGKGYKTSSSPPGKGRNIDFSPIPT